MDLDKFWNFWLTISMSSKNIIILIVFHLKELLEFLEALWKSEELVLDQNTGPLICTNFLHSETL